ncbi:MAG: tetratricopeptide repeat protein [Bacteroidota bacterium]
MTNEELLAKYLENSLSESEQAEFNKLSNTSPEFARDVRELSKIEGFLQAGTIAGSVVPEDFIASVENHVTEKIHHDKYHAPGAGGNAFTKVLSAFWIVPVLLMLGVGGFFLLRNTDHQPAQSQTNAPVLKENTGTDNSLKDQATQVAPQDNGSQTEATHQQAPKENIAANTPDEATQPETIRNPNELLGTTKNTSPANPEAAAFDRTREALNTARAEGNKPREAALLKQMGMLTAKMGNIAEARIYLNDAMNLARGLHLTTLEAESTGELGLIFKKEGNQTAAAESFKKAIELLKTAGKPTERWEKELQ